MLIGAAVEEKHAFVRLSDEQLAAIDSEKSMLYDLGVHAASEFVPRGHGRYDLMHAGRPTTESMLLRQEAFLARQPDLAQRETAQIVREFARRGVR